MTKLEFIRKLESILSEYDIEKATVKDIVEEYSMMIDEATDNGFNETDYIERLGSPRSIVRALKLEKSVKQAKEHKLVAVSPFIATALFMLLGFVYGLWHPGWLVFLLIPVIAIVTSTPKREMFVALSPFVSTTVFILLGTYYNLWHPGWLIFFIIPLFGVLSEEPNGVIKVEVELDVPGLEKEVKQSVKIFPDSKLVGVIFFLVIPVAYLILDITNRNPWNGLLFALFALYLVYKSYIELKEHGTPEALKKFGTSLVITLLIIIGYVAFNLAVNLWHPTWVVFLLIPTIIMLAVRKEEKIPFVAFTPFIATALFVVIGEMFNVYHLAWLIFFIIPIAGIMTED